MIPFKQLTAWPALMEYNIKLHTQVFNIPSNILFCFLKIYVNSDSHFGFFSGPREEEESALTS